MKARIASHGNVDSQRYQMRSDCSMCSSVGVRALLYTAALRKWLPTKTNVKTAFLQTGLASRDAYVIPPHKSKESGMVL